MTDIIGSVIAEMTSLIHTEIIIYPGAVAAVVAIIIIITRVIKGRG